MIGERGGAGDGAVAGKAACCSFELVDEKMVDETMLSR